MTENLWPDYTQDGHPPFQREARPLRRQPRPCAGCGQPIAGNYTTVLTGNHAGEDYHFQCEQAASEAGRFRRLPGEKDRPKVRVTTKAHPNDKKRRGA